MTIDFGVPNIMNSVHKASEVRGDAMLHSVGKNNAEINAKSESFVNELNLANGKYNSLVKGKENIGTNVAEASSRDFRKSEDAESCNSVENVKNDPMLRYLVSQSISSVLNGILESSFGSNNAEDNDENENSSMLADSFRNVANYGFSESIANDIVKSITKKI